MTNEERNTALYQKMFAEQEKFRDWLKGQPPEEILNHAYEYTIREDILMSLEYHDLSDAQADALMKSPSPLADVFRDFEKRETDHMETIWDCLESRADTILEEQRQALRETPVYDSGLGIRKVTEYFVHSERNLKRCSGVTMNGTGAFSVKEGFIWQPRG